MSRTWNVVLWLLGCAMAVTAVVVEMAATVTTRGIEEDSRDGSLVGVCPRLFWMPILNFGARPSGRLSLPSVSRL